MKDSKKRFFWIVVVLIPVAVLGVGEAVLRILDYGGNLDLVVRKTVFGKEYYTLNRDVARRYFSQKGIAVPEAYDDLFEVNKQPMTKRIFMLGESTMAGFPYDYNATAPRLLRDRLVQLLPQYNIEVVNAALSAVNSYTVLDFIDELVEYAPDAFVVYVGHNEFYGAMGIGSTEYLGQWRWPVKLYLWMRHIRLFLLVRDGVVALRSLIKPEATPRDVTLMEMMVREKRIPYKSREYNVARANFEANLREILSTARSHGIPIVFSTLASNIRDQRPLLATFSENASEKTKQAWETNVEEGKRARESGDFEKAFQYFGRAVEDDSMNADAYFLAGQCLDRLGCYDEARTHYEKARDLDEMRFRASTDFNDLIRGICKEEKVPLADAEHAFETQSPHGLVGSNLMLEHLHPNFDGYLLLAKTFLRTMADSTTFVAPQEWQWNRDLTDDEFKARSGVTEFDLEAAKFRIFELTAGWPFTREPGAKPEYPMDTKVRQLAVAYVRKRLAWSQARYDLGDGYVQRGEYEKGYKEYFAVSKVLPYYYYPFMKMGDVNRLMNKTPLAEESYMQALTKQNSPYVHVRLGMLYFEEGKTGEAIREFEGTVGLEDKGTERMNARDRSGARYLLAVAYGKNGEIEKAKSALRSALAIDPGNQEAKKLLSQLGER